MSLTDRETHFEFGENWKDYARSVDKSRIEQAIVALRKLFPDGLAGKSFLDIGCGSGLHSIAALALGAASVTAVDIDENSVIAARGLLTKHASDGNWSVSVASVFDLTPEKTGSFDIVYSWGVLHHTGDMWRAIEAASRLLKPGGLYALAIYTKTPLCGFWRREKAIYARSPGIIQSALRFVYMAAFLGYLPATGYKPIGFVRNFKTSRGMNFSTNVHDWLGGYPYDSASADEMQSRLVGLGLTEVRSFVIDPGSGIWSAGCSEYVYARPLQHSPAPT
jgi:2-polyprenyl-6-hydroxyphenyl methylase/3-demethylubiquinone-9 3-methyltransferase